MHTVQIIQLRRRVTASYSTRKNGEKMKYEEADMSTIVVNNVSGESGRKLPQFIAGLAASGGALAAGTFLGWTNPTEAPLTKENEYGFPVSTETFSWIGSISNLGAALMCFPIGYMMKIIGRKWSMLSMVLPLVLGWLLIIFAENVAMLLVGRLFLGIGGGAFCVAAPTYTAEIAQPSIRGTLGTFFQLMVTVGILFVYAVGTGVNVQVLSIICGVIPLVFGSIFFFMPESPYYYIEKGQYSEASKSLKWLRGSHYDENAEMEDMKEEDSKLKAEAITMLDAFRQKATIRALVISLGLMFFQQLSGINAVIFYNAAIFKSANGDEDMTSASVIVGGIQVVATLVAAIVVDKVGRRILLMVSDFMMAVSTILLAVYFQLKQDDPSKVDDLSWLAVLAVCMFIAMFSIGFGPVPWLMIGELFANNVKAFASPIAGVFNWLLAFLVTKIFTNLTDAMGEAGVFWLFSGLSLLGTVFVYVIVPETKGKSLNEIQRVLAGEQLETSKQKIESQIDDISATGT